MAQHDDTPDTEPGQTGRSRLLPPSGCWGDSIRTPRQDAMRRLSGLLRVWADEELSEQRQQEAIRLANYVFRPDW